MQALTPRWRRLNREKADADRGREGWLVCPGIRACEVGPRRGGRFPPCRRDAARPGSSGRLPPPGWRPARGSPQEELALVGVGPIRQSVANGRFAWHRAGAPCVWPLSIDLRRALHGQPAPSPPGPCPRPGGPLRGAVPGRPSAAPRRAQDALDALTLKVGLHVVRPLPGHVNQHLLPLGPDLRLRIAHLHGNLLRI